MARQGSRGLRTKVGLILVMWVALVGMIDVHHRITEGRMADGLGWSLIVALFAVELAGAFALSRRRRS
jgi:hypothetical protein